MSKKILLIFILLVATILRLVQITNFPAGLNADEAALGYNAYSLMKTGRDEHGHPWPVNLESFGDFKPAGYTYILIPFIKLFGLNEFSVRLPSAIFGILAVYLVYKLAKSTVGSEHFIAAVLAFSPWHIQFSRGGWEVNVASTLILLAVYQFTLWLESKSYRYLCVSFFSLIFSMYVYQSARILAPLFGLALIILNMYVVKKQLKQFFLVCILSLVLIAPLAYSIVSSNAASRFSGVGFTADMGPLNRINELRGQHLNQNGFISKMLHNKPIAYGFQFISNYLDHFNGNFLFVNGDVIHRNKTPETGLLYFTDIVFVIIGTIFLIKSKNKSKNIVWVWLFFSPIPAALTFQTPHALRAQNMVIPLSFLVGLGIYATIKSFGKYKYFVTACICCVYAWQVARFIHEYTVHYPKTYPDAWEYGFKQITSEIKAHGDQYQKIIVTDIYDQPYILILFYLKYDPELFQKNHQLTPRDKFNFSTVTSFDKFSFEKIDWEKIKNSKNTLLIGRKDEIPDIKLDNVITIPDPDGNPGFKIVQLP